MSVAWFCVFPTLVRKRTVEMADFRTILFWFIALSGSSALAIPGLAQQKPATQPANRTFVEPMVARVELRLAPPPQKPLAEKLLELYRNEKPFDPDLKIEPTTEPVASADSVPTSP